ILHSGVQKIFVALWNPSISPSAPSHSPRIKGGALSSDTAIRCERGSCEVTWQNSRVPVCSNAVARAC
ncbi:hypothetical protein PMAYCL1PPCAC_28051, partial [Pristionchus mayeri]